MNPTHRFEYVGLGRWQITGGAFRLSPNFSSACIDPQWSHMTSGISSRRWSVRSAGSWYPATGSEKHLVLTTETVTVDDDARGWGGLGWASPAAALAGLLRRVHSLLVLMPAPMASGVLLDLRTARMESARPRAVDLSRGAV